MSNWDKAVKEAEKYAEQDAETLRTAWERLKDCGEEPAAVALLEEVNAAKERFVLRQDFANAAACRDVERELQASIREFRRIARGAETD